MLLPIAIFLQAIPQGQLQHHPEGTLSNPLSKADRSINQKVDVQIKFRQKVLKEFQKT
jgi:hypothetical protein